MAEFGHQSSGVRLSSSSRSAALVRSPWLWLILANRIVHLPGTKRALVSGPASQNDKNHLQLTLRQGGGATIVFLPRAKH